MFWITAASAIYYTLILIGLGLAGALVLRRFQFFKIVPDWQLALLSFGLWPALISWAGFARIGIYIPFAEIVGFSAAFFSLVWTWRHWKKLATACRHTRKDKTTLSLTFLSVAGFSIFVAAQWCYFFGGFNNLDQFRGLSFIAALNANDFKPAHPLDLSVPMSYGYYFYQYSALMFGSVGGRGWPSAALFVSALAAIFSFYFVFIKFTRIFLNYKFAGWQILTVLAVSFYGLDFIPPSKYTADWWNMTQITQMSAYWHWVYHYLFAAALGMTSLLCLHDALKDRQPAQLVMALLFLVLTPLYATIMGVFFTAVFILYTLLHVIANWRIVIFWAYFGLRVRDAVIVVSCLAGAATLLILPQIFTFIGRGGYLTLTLDPKMWFSRKSMFDATAIEWKNFSMTMMIELGFLHFIALFFLPAFAYIIFKSNKHAGLLLISLMSATVFSLTFVVPQSYDWYWRTGNFSLILLSSLSVVWLVSMAQHKGTVVASASWIAVALLLAPGAWNFAYETQLRMANCIPAGEGALKINQNTNIKTVISYKNEEILSGKREYKLPTDHPWEQTNATFSKDEFVLTSERQAVLSQAMQAGRASLGQENPMWKILFVYLLKPAFLQEHFDWKKNHSPCEATWYGSALPRRKFVEVTQLYQSPVFKEITCQSALKF